MNHSHLIKHHNLNRYTRGVNNIRAAVRKLDADLRALERRQDLFEGERQRRQVEVRETAEAEIAQHRKDLAETVAEHRGWANYSDDPPTAQEAARRTYYSQRAVAELAGLAPADALVRIQQVAATGDHEQAREYVAAARGRVPAGSLRAVERQVEEPDAAGARYWGAAVDEVERQVGWLDWHIEKLMERVGHISPEAREGTAPEQAVDVRVLDLWRDGLSGHAAKAFEASKAAEGQWSGVAEALPTAGTEGYDADDQQAPAAEDQEAEL